MSTATDAILVDLNPEQTKAVIHESGPLLIVAGAGTGKTAVITRRIAWLIASGLAKPDEILALTFTEKAAGEMEERVDRLLPYGYVDLWISTFHAFGERMLRSHGLEIGLPDGFKVLSETEQWLLLRRHLTRLNLKHYRPLGNPTRFLVALLNHFSRAQDEMVTPKGYLEYVESLRLNSDSADLPADELGRLLEVADSFHTYKTILREEDRMDFSDLINESLRLFRARPALLDAHRRQFKYVLVDEFQDTNAAQYELVKLLVNSNRNLTVVGDDDQSIYKFRGAAISNILEFRRDYADATQVVLGINYRSRQNILDFAYRFIQHNNPNRLETTLGVGKNLAAARDGQGTIEHLHGKTLADEARLVIEKIMVIRAADPESSWNDFAILVRANDHADPFLQALMMAGIPHDFVANRGLYSKPIILDILNYLRLLDNYHESPAVYRTLNTPIFDIPAQELVVLTNYANRKSLSLYDALKICEAIPGVSPTTAVQVKKLISLVDKHSELARREPVGKVVLVFLHDAGYLKAALGRDEAAAREDARILNQFWKCIESFAAEESEPTVKNFLERIRLELASGDSGELPTDPESGPELVRVMTVHASKGLEFRHVFLVNLVDRRFPTSERKESIPLPDVFVRETLSSGDAHLEEERRLFYVACTRARDGLYLASAEDYGGARKKRISRFLVEAGLPEPEPRTTKPPQPRESERPVVSGAVFSLPEKLSFTQIKAYDSCPLQYKFAHLLRIPIRGKQMFSFGKSVHGALQAFFQLVRERQSQSQQTLFTSAAAGPTALPTWDDLNRFYGERWVDDWYNSAAEREERFNKGREALKTYYEKISRSWPQIAAVENSFVLKIDEVALRGVIDRIDLLPDGTVEIIDYKTGETKTEKTVEWDQLLIYQIAAEQVLGLRPSRLTYEYIEKGASLSTIGTPDDLSRVKEKITEAATKIRTSDFAPTPDKRTCTSCDFRDICDFRAV